jgi:ribA/ribD-fused uncharacterized protein
VNADVTLQVIAYTRHAHTCSNQKKFGRLVRNFDPLVWDAEALEIMTTVVLQKFQQHADYAAFLLATENKELIECSRVGSLKTTKRSNAPDQENLSHTHSVRVLT